MKPVDVPQSNKRLTKPSTMPECGDLPVYNDGQVSVSCWKPSLRERISILLFGRVWLWVVAGKTQPPVSLEGWKEAFYKECTK